MPPHLNEIPKSRQQDTKGVAHHGQRFNAFKHGAYAEAALLPDEDGAEFARRRQALFHLYRPQTVDEAEAVDDIAECQWIRQRLRPLQAEYDQQMVSPERDAAGRVCEPNGHTRIHSATDVSVRRGRVDLAEKRARSQLFLQQKQRRQGLVAGACKLPADCYMDVDGAIRGPVPLPNLTPVPEVVPESASAPCQVVPAQGPNDSNDGSNGFSTEQKERDGENGHAARQGIGQNGRQLGEMDLPAWLTALDRPHRTVPPTVLGSAAWWEGYTAVGSA